jgi:hypothetical protein
MYVFVSVNVNLLCKCPSVFSLSLTCCVVSRYPYICVSLRFFLSSVSLSGSVQVLLLSATGDRFVAKCRTEGFTVKTKKPKKSKAKAKKGTSAAAAAAAAATPLTARSRLFSPVFYRIQRHKKEHLITNQVKQSHDSFYRTMFFFFIFLMPCPPPPALSLCLSLCLSLFSLSLSLSLSLFSLFSLSLSPPSPLAPWMLTISCRPRFEPAPITSTQVAVAVVVGVTLL